MKEVVQYTKDEYEAMYALAHDALLDFERLELKDSYLKFMVHDNLRRLFNVIQGVEII